MSEATDIDAHRNAYACTHVFEGVKPVLLVSRADGDWCFLCGDEHENAASSYRVVGIGHVVQRDRTLEALLDLPPEWEAERQSPIGHGYEPRVYLKTPS
jgi:hypothetical protein